ncbi:hypothetical protein LCGC14_1885040 [marine sediment metagenome]|uniref:Uncharacterized protein n=1 Tax=marine sediment metagenome TaxID=412755 RepID=A0A0F9G141_9ZZZZ
MQQTSQHHRMVGRQVMAGFHDLYLLFKLYLEHPKEYEKFETSVAECHDLKDVMRPKIEAMEAEAEGLAAEKVRVADAYAVQTKETADRSAEAARENARNEARIKIDRANTVRDEAGRRLAEAEKAEANLVGRAEALDERDRLLTARDGRLATAQERLKTEKQAFTDMQRRVTEAYKGAA